MKLFAFTFVSFLLMACSSSKKAPEAVIDPIVPAKKASQLLKPDLQPHHPENSREKTKDQPLWSYTGLTGPDMWGELKEDYILCKIGKLQSPIDLLWKKPQGKMAIEFNYKDTPYKIVDNGHTVQVQFEAGNQITMNGHTYDLKHLDFHAHSEHAISGKHYSLEAHFYHKDKDGQLVILAVLFTEGKANPFLESMWEQFPREKNRQVASQVSFNPADLLPKVKTHYHYTGSLTIPPCSENVKWNVFNTPVEMSSEQINHFKVLYSKNYRPLQPINGRTVINH